MQKVIIWDINQSRIKEVISAFSNLGVMAGFNVDVSNIKQIQEAAKKVKQELGELMFLSIMLE